MAWDRWCVIGVVMAGLAMMSFVVASSGTEGESEVLELLSDPANPSSGWYLDIETYDRVWYDADEGELTARAPAMLYIALQPLWHEGNCEDRASAEFAALNRHCGVIGGDCNWNEATMWDKDKASAADLAEGWCNALKIQVAGGDEDPEGPENTTIQYRPGVRIYDPDPDDPQGQHADDYSIDVELDWTWEGRGTERFPVENFEQPLFFSEEDHLPEPEGCLDTVADVPSVDGLIVDCVWAPSEPFTVRGDVMMNWEDEELCAAFDNFGNCEDWQEVDGFWARPQIEDLIAEESLDSSAQCSECVSLARP